MTHVIDQRLQLPETHRDAVMKTQERLMIEANFWDASLSGWKDQVDGPVKQGLRRNIVGNALTFKLIERLIEKMIGAVSCSRIGFIILAAIPGGSCVVRAKLFISHTSILFRKRSKIKKCRFSTSGGL